MQTPLRRTCSEVDPFLFGVSFPRSARIVDLLGSPQTQTVGLVFGLDPADNQTLA